TTSGGGREPGKSDDYGAPHLATGPIRSYPPGPACFASQGPCQAGFSVQFPRSAQLARRPATPWLPTEPLMIEFRSLCRSPRAGVLPTPLVMRASPRGGLSVPLRDLDRNLIDRCLRKEPGAWNDFVDRYMGLIYHVIHHAAHARSRVLSSEDI